ncbi:glucuronate isomerase [Cellulomonas sp. Marseille-Q8402]
MAPLPTPVAPPRLTLHPDRLLPPDPGTRSVARELYAAVRDLPIISPHGHVPARWLAEDVPFPDPTALLITPDHYVTRLLHARGVPLADLGVGVGVATPAQSRAAFRLLCAHWPAFRGTPVKLWLEQVLVEVLGVDLVPSPATADDLYDAVADRVADPGFRPRALYDRFRIDVLATTDDPCDDLRHHAALRDDPAWHGRVVPTFRPDRYLEAGRPEWSGRVDALGEVAGVDTGTLAGWLDAMERRRATFAAHGAVSADHGHRDARMAPLDPAEGERLYALARAGGATPAEAERLRQGLLFEMARMSSEDGLVMTLHPGVSRDHHTPSRTRYGTDIGADIPGPVEFTEALRLVLQAFGTHPRFRLVVFTVDETTFSRELAPLAGFYPSLYVGAPWWFLDAPDAMERYRAAVTETAGFTKTSGFVDDTRAYLSIPARHDASRRADAAYLARLVTDHRLTLDEAHETARELVTTTPREAFRL